MTSLILNQRDLKLSKGVLNLSSLAMKHLNREIDLKIGPVIIVGSIIFVSLQRKIQQLVMRMFLQLIIRIFQMLLNY